MAKKLPNRSRSRSPNSNPRRRSTLASRLAHRPASHRRTSRRRLFGPKNMNQLLSSISYNTRGTIVYSRVDPRGQPGGGAASGSVLTLHGNGAASGSVLTFHGNDAASG